MPTFYNFTENGLVYSFDAIFVPADLFREGNLYSWGTGLFGRLGNNATTVRSTPITTFSGGSNWKQVSVKDHSAAIKTDGTLWIWGNGSDGSLGNNSINARLTPVTTFAGGNNWKQVSVGGNHTAAIKTDGTLWTWGLGTSGQLGTNNTTSRSTPITTFAGGNNWKQVSIGFNYTSAIKTDGTLWTWGHSGYGKLGTNATSDKSTPVTTFSGGTNWKQVSAGTFHIAAIKTDGTLWTWGRNSYGHLGINNTIHKSTPVTTFLGGSNWKQVECGYNHTAAIKTDGTLWLWGGNSYGHLGTNNTISRSTPVTTFAGGTNWKQVSLGDFYTTAIKTDGTLWIWGHGAYGKLGTNNAISRSTPVTTFAGGTNWKQVSCGENHVITLTYIDPML